MLYLTGTDWFSASWRLLPASRGHMAAESAKSFPCARVCVCVSRSEEEEAV